MLFDEYLGETEWTRLLEAFEEHPELLKKPYFDRELDTGETIVHLLTKEGCIELLTTLLYSDGKLKFEKTLLVKALLQYDNTGWSPLMSCVKADQNVEEVINLCLKFLDENAVASDVDEMISSQRVRNTVLILIYAYNKTVEINIM